MYKRTIEEDLEKMDRRDVDPRHVEAFIRLEWATLDGLSRYAFRQETRIAVACIDEVGVDSAERLADSFGL